MDTQQAQRSQTRLWNSNYLKVWSANFMIFFSFMLLAPLLPLYLNERFGATPQDIGMVLSGYTITALVVRTLSGYLVDNFPRKTVLLVSYGVFALMFGGYMIAGSLLAFTVIRTLHGVPFGATTVSNSTVAIDVLPSERRTEGIGYYGLSNNLATAIGPTVAMALFGIIGSYDFLFAFSLAVAATGWLINSTLKLKERPLKGKRPHLSLDRFLLLNGWSEGITMICFSFSYGVLATYIAIYAVGELGMASGTGLFFMLLALGLILSRLTGGRSLRKGRIVHNASIGIPVSAVGYLLFAGIHTPGAFYIAALTIGLGNGHMFPAFQNMFINLATNEQRGTANSTLLVSWDIGVGLGVLAGGIVAEHLGFHSAFWAAWIVNMVGVVLYFTYVRHHFTRNKLR